MKTRLLWAILIVLTTTKTFAQHDEWTITRDRLLESDTLKPNVKYCLSNHKSKQTLGYKRQKKGINLGWFKPQNNQMNIVFKDQNDDGILDQQDSVAIYVEGGAYLKYGAREYSINMVWSPTPVYEWAIVFDNQSVTKRYALYNRTKQAYLIYAEQGDVGVRLQWSDEW